MERYSVLIVDSNQDNRLALCTAIGKNKTLKLLAAVSSYKQALVQLATHNPHAMLIASNLPDANALDLLRLIKNQGYQTKALFIATPGDTRDVLDVLRAGASGYLYQSRHSTKITDAVLQIINGATPIDPWATRLLVDKLNTEQAQRTDNKQNLTGQEATVLAFLSKGCTMKETAVHMGISRHTIDSHVRNIYKKLSVHTRAEAISEAYQLGFIKQYSQAQ